MRLTIASAPSSASQYLLNTSHITPQQAGPILSRIAPRLAAVHHLTVSSCTGAACQQPVHASAAEGFGSAACQLLLHTKLWWTASQQLLSRLRRQSTSPAMLAGSCLYNYCLAAGERCQPASHHHRPSGTLRWALTHCRGKCSHLFGGTVRLPRPTRRGFASTAVGLPLPPARLGGCCLLLCRILTCST